MLLAIVATATVVPAAAKAKLADSGASMAGYMLDNFTYVACGPWLHKAAGSLHEPLLTMIYDIICFTRL